MIYLPENNTRVFSLIYNLIRVHVLIISIQIYKDTKMLRVEKIVRIYRTLKFKETEFY